jgi:hypothetical protein
MYMLLEKINDISFFLSDVSKLPAQEYTERKLLAMDKAGNELVMDVFRFPSCCVCSIIRRLHYFSEVCTVQKIIFSAYFCDNNLAASKNPTHFLYFQILDFRAIGSVKEAKQN